MTTQSHEKKFNLNSCPTSNTTVILYQKKHNEKKKKRHLVKVGSGNNHRDVEVG